MRAEAEDRVKRLREEISNRIQEFGSSLQSTLRDTSETTIKRVNEISESNERRQAELRKTIEEQLEKLRDDNARKLTEMQKSVDEKLEGTLQKRLGESFRLHERNRTRPESSPATPQRPPMASGKVIEGAGSHLRQSSAIHRIRTDLAE